MDRPNLLQRPLTTVPGIGTVKAALFAKLGIFSTGDLLYHFPRAYQNRGAVRSLADAAKAGDIGALCLTVGSSPVAVRLNGGRYLVKFTAFDESGKCTVVFFNATYVRQVFQLGQAFRFWGKVTRSKSGKGYELTAPAFEPYREDLPLPDFLPVYPLTEKLSQKTVSTAIGLLLTEEIPESDDPLPQEIREKYRLLSLGRALRSIHFPDNYEELDQARKRFIFEELYIFSLAMGKAKEVRRECASGIPRFYNTELSALYGRLPFTLTGDQTRAIADICADVSDPSKNAPMARLISGDVGSGKTVCAAAAAVLAIQNGYQAALMVPTEILATQHYRDLQPLLQEMGYRTELLTGSLSAAKKRALRKECAQGSVDLLIGTHALLTEDTAFARLGLVITDEQHRFGVLQRAGLSDKGTCVHTLVLTATPIPRTLALILYSDLSISRIEEMPPGRQKVDTFLVNHGYQDRLYAFIRKQIQQGNQVYIVCPAVDCDMEDEEDAASIDLGYRPEKGTDTALPLKSVVQYAKQLQETVFPDCCVGLLHGKMKAAEKDRAMSEFAAGKTQILVSTTVIEVGVNVPNATLMVVENAERFGLSQLHQLRGRVGRGRDKSYCVLVSDAKPGSSAVERLTVLKNSANGFRIAEADLKQRGPGDFFPQSSGSTRQHGALPFRMASLCDSTELLLEANAAAKETLEKDPSLSLPEQQSAANKLTELFTLNQNTWN